MEVEVDVDVDVEVEVEAVENEVDVVVNVELLVVVDSDVEVLLEVEDELLVLELAATTAWFMFKQLSVIVHSVRQTTHEAEPRQTYFADFDSQTL